MADTTTAELQQTQSVTAAFNAGLREMRGTLSATSRDVAGLERGLSQGLRRAFDGLVFDGDRLSTAVSSIAQSVQNAAYNAAMRPITDKIGGWLASGIESLMPFAEGGTFTQGRVMPFAKGGVVTAPTTFPMRGGTGLMGEAGPEAIMPLTRGADGRLGVAAQGGGGVNLVMNIQTPDAASFHRSQSQIGAQVSRLVARGNRNR
ncbi:phage tail tape measure protein [Ketogulonicigenium vulgare]|uniref:Phage-related minor tail protein-like protein n=1 Tax=Ketogulonicigenium vulgare (strain WSH-001) TaxID=759362 RepID=F9Y463_KETVW|nr:phage tail tape measure protein [Ketogulonicigenium vulgare]ADO42305.1 putative phage tail minor protein [Ketogulonicigenium vulgare Y25]AEM40499.1 Phage-related minor tail protein-like protein [Ketogulonicigenium vulgare WSH-001]ALJ80684.1 phage tail protein [Ketogulonicigenium vulgare]ANW33491.1 phage tail protein [Ketogulonicigenium vulgare]AOZ54216.1 phage tail minor protein [Ketogulonicigenium vulgare]